MKKYKVIIVGGGPSGVAAAKILKDNNINFCIIDKNKFPRPKLCGGGLTNKSVNLLKELNFNIKNINTKTCKKVKLVAHGVEKDMPLVNNIIMVDRYEFDHSNLKQVTNKNLFIENIIELKDNQLITDKNKYQFDYLIFADGVNGFSRKLIKDRKFGFCVEAELKKEVKDTIIDFAAIKNGYGWYFSKNKHTTIGVGNFNYKKNDYREVLKNFALKYNNKITDKEIKGYPIPLYSKKVYKNSVINNNIIIVGDAASLVDSVSGEGIYYALLSGKRAAESIVESINENKDVSKIYFEKAKDIDKALSKRNFLATLLYSKFTTFFIKLGLSNKYFIKKIHNLFG